MSAKYRTRGVAGGSGGRPPELHSVGLAGLRVSPLVFRHDSRRAGAARHDCRDSGDGGGRGRGRFRRGGHGPPRAGDRRLLPGVRISGRRRLPARHRTAGPDPAAARPRRRGRPGLAAGPGRPRPGRGDRRAGPAAPLVRGRRGAGRFRRGRADLVGGVRRGRRLSRHAAAPRQRTVRRAGSDVLGQRRAPGPGRRARPRPTGGAAQRGAGAQPVRVGPGTARQLPRPPPRGHERRH